MSERGGVNLLCHGRARASFSLTLRAGAMLRLLDRIGPPGRCSGCWRRPRRSQLRGQLRHDPIAPAGSGGSGVLSLRHFGLVLFIPWRVGAEESGAAKNGFGAATGGALTYFVTLARARELFLNSQCRRDAARPDRAAWAVQRLLAAAATLSATGSASPRPDRTSWPGGRW